VKDTRETRLDAACSKSSSPTSRPQIDPTSVHSQVLTDPAGLRILEQNYEYDLLDQRQAHGKYVGRRSASNQSNGTYQEATLLSTNGPIYRDHGQIHMAHSGQLVLPALPEPRLKPTLSGCCATPARRPSGSKLVPDHGINWKADSSWSSTPADNRSD